MLSVCPSICLSISVCDTSYSNCVLKMNRKCPLRIQFYNFQPITPIMSTENYIT